MFVETGWFISTLQFGPDDVFVIEDWDETPAGPYVAIFHFSPQDYRTLYVSSAEGRDLVSTIHRFDEMYVTDIASRRQDGRWTIDIDTGDRGALHIEVDYRESTLLKLANPIVCHTPDAVTRSRLYCKLVPRVAAPILGTDPDYKLAGATELGRKSRFRLRRLYLVPSARCTWDGREIGPLVDCCYQHDMGDWYTTKAIVCYLSLFVE